MKLCSFVGYINSLNSNHWGCKGGRWSELHRYPQM